MTDKYPRTLDEVFKSKDHREMLVALAGYGLHGMIYKPDNDEVEKQIGCLFSLKLIHQRRNYNDNIIACTNMCIAKMLKRKIIKLEDIPPRERLGFR